MKKVITFERSVQLTVLLFILIIIFHLVIILGIVVFDFVPLDFLWGGRMKTKAQLLSFELISFVVMLMCLLIVLVRSGSLNIPSLSTFARVALWILVLLFLLNTFGNILAKTTFEKCFGIITAILSILCLRLAIGPGSK